MIAINILSMFYIIGSWILLQRSLQLPLKFQKNVICHPLGDAKFCKGIFTVENCWLWLLLKATPLLLDINAKTLAFPAIIINSYEIHDYVVGVTHART